MRSSGTIGQNTGNDAGRGGRPRRAVEHVHDRPARQPVVEIPEHDEQCSREPSRDTRGSAGPGTGARGRAGRGAPRARAAGVRPTSIVAASAPRGSRRSDRQIDPMHLDDRMAREQRVAEALRHGLPRRAERALIAIERRQTTGGRVSSATLAGYVNSCSATMSASSSPMTDGHAIGIVAAVGPDARVHVVGRDPDSRGAPQAISQTPPARGDRETDGANCRIRRNVRSPAASATSSSAGARSVISRVRRRTGAAASGEAAAQTAERGDDRRQPDHGAGQVGRERHAAGAAEQMHRAGARDRRQAQHDRRRPRRALRAAERIDTTAGSSTVSARPVRSPGPPHSRSLPRPVTRAARPRRREQRRTPRQRRSRATSSGTSARPPGQRRQRRSRAHAGRLGAAGSGLNGREFRRLTSADDSAAMATATASTMPGSRTGANCVRCVASIGGTSSVDRRAEPERLVGIGGSSQTPRTAGARVAAATSIRDQRVVGRARGRRGARAASRRARCPRATSSAARSQMLGEQAIANPPNPCPRRRERRARPRPHRIRCPRPSSAASSSPIRSAPARRRRSSPSSGRRSARLRARRGGIHEPQPLVACPRPATARNTPSRKAPIVFLSSQPWHSLGTTTTTSGPSGSRSRSASARAQHVVREVLALDVDRPVSPRRSNPETAPRTRGRPARASDPGHRPGDGDVDVRRGRA